MCYKYYIMYSDALAERRPIRLRRTVVVAAVHQRCPPAIWCTSVCRVSVFGSHVNSAAAAQVCSSSIHVRWCERAGQLTCLSKSYCTYARHVQYMCMCTADAIDHEYQQLYHCISRAMNRLASLLTTVMDTRRSFIASVHGRAPYTDQLHKRTANLGAWLTFITSVSVEQIQHGDVYFFVMINHSKATIYW